MKICYNCKIEKELKDYHKQTLAKDGHRNICILCVKEYTFKNRTKCNLNRINNHLKKNYGITLDQKNQMVIDQKGLCLCCGENLGTNPYNIHVDHDHETGKVRGILCNGCNVGLGGFKDNINKLNKAIIYLKTIGDKNESK
jgi:hypothetical protein